MKTGFHGPRSRDNARLLIDAAKSLGYPTAVVKTTAGGYKAPQDVVDAALGVSGIQEGVVYPAPAEEVPVAPVADEDAAEETVEETDEPQRPNNGASRAEWVDYAKRSVGYIATDDDTRNGLIEKVDALQEGTH